MIDAILMARRSYGICHAHDTLALIHICTALFLVSLPDFIVLRFALCVMTGTADI